MITKENTKNEILENWAELDERAEEYLAMLRKNKIISSTRAVSVRDWNRRCVENSLVVNNEYQRAEGAWKTRMKQGLLYTLLRGQPVFPITIAYNMDTGQYEIVDGQHRLLVINQFIAGKIALPKWIPSELGGGKTIEHVHPRLVEEILGAYIDERELKSETGKPLTIEQIKDVYSNMQKSVQLTLGQEVRAKYGEYKELMSDLSKHPISGTFIKRADRELQFAAYLFNYVYCTTHNRTISFNKDNILNLVDETAELKCEQNIREKCFVLIDILQDVCSDKNYELNAFYAMAIVSSADTLIMKGIPLDILRVELKEAFSRIWDLICKLKDENDHSLNLNDHFIRTINNISQNASITNGITKLFEFKNCILAVYENAGIPK